MKIAFFSAKSYDKTFFDQENTCHDFFYFDAQLNESTAHLAKGCDALCVFVSDVVNANVAHALSEYGIGLICLRCAGFNNISIDAASQNKIHVVNVPSYSPYAVAEFAVGLMLNLNRKIHKAYLRSLGHNFNIENLMGFDMRGKTVGIVGLGKIGRAVADILNGFGMTIMAYDIMKDKAPSYVHYVDLDTLYKESDIITLHCPLTDKTHHMIDDDAFSKMKNSVILINTGRGKIINTKSLIRALKKGWIESVGLDVYEEESDYFYLDYSNKIIQDDDLVRLLTFPNVLITSHQAFFTKEAMHSIVCTTLSSIKAFQEGAKPIYDLTNF